MTDREAYDEGYDAYWDGLEREDIPIIRSRSPRNTTPGKRAGERPENMIMMKMIDPRPQPKARLL